MKRLFLRRWQAASSSLAVFASACVCLFVESGWAGNPLISPSGAMIRWSSQSVAYNLSPGGLGPYSGEEIRSIAAGVARAWNRVPHSNITLEEGPFLEEPVTTENVVHFINNSVKGVNPVILDSDGAITEFLFGKGASESILGVASPEYERNGNIRRSSVILNGRLFTGSFGELNELWSTMLHEFGHFLGVGHSQLFPEFAFDNDPTTNLHLPVMFPLAANEGISTQTLSWDDEVTLAFMYPKPSFFEERGRIEGAVFRPWGDPVQGANVTAIHVERPLKLSFSAVSDRMIEFTGEFVFPGLPEGEYYLKIEPIHPSLYGDSGVGPFAETPNSPSFINPVPPEYYSGERESGIIGEDDPEDREPVYVRAGEVVTGIEIITNEELPSAVIDWPIFSD
jgi:hypothetical protein